MTKKNGVIKKCKNCQKDFYVHKSRIQTANFCSCRCAGEAKRGVPSWNKGKKWSTAYKKKLSSIHSKSYKNGRVHPLLGTERKDMQGKNNPNWRGGISTELQMRVTSPKWIRIRKLIYARDNFECQLCGKHGGKLQCHHIIPFRISQDNSPENLITLCPSCHMKVEFGGVKI